MAPADFQSIKYSLDHVYDVTMDDARREEGRASGGVRHADAPPSNRDRSQTGDEVDPDGAAGPFDFEL